MDDAKIEKWSAAFDDLVEARKRLREAATKKDKAIEAYKKDHHDVLEAYNSASEDLD
jgi:hypothetical protein